MENKTTGSLRYSILDKIPAALSIGETRLDYAAVAVSIIDTSRNDLKKIGSERSRRQIIEAYRFLFGTHENDRKWRDFWFGLTDLDQDRTINGIRHELFVKDWVGRDALISDIEKWEGAFNPGFEGSMDENKPPEPTPAMNRNKMLSEMAAYEERLVAEIDRAESSDARRRNRGRWIDRMRRRLEFCAHLRRIAEYVIRDDALERRQARDFLGKKVFVQRMVAAVYGIAEESPKIDRKVVEKRHLRGTAADLERRAMMYDARKDRGGSIIGKIVLQLIRGVPGSEWAQFMSPDRPRGVYKKPRESPTADMIRRGAIGEGAEDSLEILSCRGQLNSRHLYVAKKAIEIEELSGDAANWPRVKILLKEIYDKMPLTLAGVRVPKDLAELHMSASGVRDRTTQIILRDAKSAAIRADVDKIIRARAMVKDPRYLALASFHASVRAALETHAKKDILKYMEKEIRNNKENSPKEIIMRRIQEIEELATDQKNYPRVTRLMKNLYDVYANWPCLDDVPDPLIKNGNSKSENISRSSRIIKARSVESIRDAVAEYVAIKMLNGFRKIRIPAAFHFETMRAIDKMGADAVLARAEAEAARDPKMEIRARIVRAAVDIDALAKINDAPAWARVKKRLADIYDIKLVVPGVADPMTGELKNRNERKRESSRLLDHDAADNLNAAIDRYIDIKTQVNRKSMRQIAALHRQIRERGK